jgi:hypothetical protein
VFTGLLDTLDLTLKCNLNASKPIAGTIKTDAKAFADGKAAFWFVGDYQWPLLQSLGASPEGDGYGIMPVPVSVDAADPWNQKILATSSFMLAIGKTGNPRTEHLSPRPGRPVGSRRACRRLLARFRRQRHGTDHDVPDPGPPSRAAAIAANLTRKQLCAWEPAITTIERQRPLWRLGSAHSYHPLTIGWLAGEVIRRITGLTPGRFFRQSVGDPLGLDIWIGLPEPGRGGVDGTPAPGRGQPDLGQRWGTGFMLSSPPSRPMLSKYSFGHDGAGGQLAFADETYRLGFAYLKCALDRPI